MQRAKLAMPFHSCRSCAAVGPPPLFGSRWAQARVAVWYWELPAASRFRVVLLNCPLLSGSGKSGTPCERTQRAYASAAVAAVAACAEPPGPADDGLPVHAADVRARVAAAMMTA